MIVDKNVLGYIGGQLWRVPLSNKRAWERRDISDEEARICTNEGFV